MGAVIAITHVFDRTWSPSTSRDLIAIKCWSRQALPWSNTTIKDLAQQWEVQCLHNCKICVFKVWSNKPEPQQQSTANLGYGKVHGWHVRNNPKRKCYSMLSLPFGFSWFLGKWKLMYEEEIDGEIPFLETSLVRKEDGSVRLLVYCNRTHTDQYLNFISHHQLHQKLGVIRTLLNRCDNVMTKERSETRRLKRNTLLVH